MIHLSETLELHELWLQSPSDGRRGDFENEILRWENLSYKNLSNAIFRGADMSGANLKAATLIGSDLARTNLFKANLSWANLTGVDLRGTIGNGVEIKSLFVGRWPITYTADRLQIGCENHAIEEWVGFDDVRIGSTTPHALEFWKKWRPVIFQIIEMSPATPTGHEGKAV